MGHGFEIIKRPGLNRFIQEMGKHYELVIFGTEDSQFVEEICEKLDQFELNIKYKLGKEATRLEKGKYVKDLRSLNRNLKNVVVIDFDLENVKYTPLNAVIIPEFTGDTKDKELLNLIPFLKGTL
jgi:import inner membrane translocase subunit TIM50